MRVRIGLLIVLLAGGCRSARSASGSPDSSDPPDCAAAVGKARRIGADSVFSNAGGLVERCPDAVVAVLTALWEDRTLTPERAIALRRVSALLRDQRLATALTAVVQDAARPVETRVEALSTLSFYLQAGRWIEFTFLSDHPDSASLRMFMGVLEHPVVTRGSQPLPADFPVSFRTLLESLPQSDSSSAIRSAARRFVVFLDYAREHHN